MGCCLTKKSRENRLVVRPSARNPISQPLIVDESGRSVSLQKQDADFPRNMSEASYEAASYDPPASVSSIDISEESVSRQVIGSSLLLPPALESLNKSDWLLKRGHMVRNWKKRFVVLDDGELQYFERAAGSPPVGVSLKGELHLLGAICDMTREDNAPCVNIVGRQGEKDLLLQFNSEAQAKEWFDAINWTIYSWNVNAISSGEDTQDIEKWYTQQRDLFEERYNAISRGCRFYKHTVNAAGKPVVTLCHVQGVRDTLCIGWCTLTGDAASGRAKKSPLRYIPLSEITDVIRGTFAGEEVPVISLVTNSQTLDLQVIDEQNTDAFLDALTRILIFIAIPVPKGMTGVMSTASNNKKMAKKSGSKAQKKSG